MTRWTSIEKITPRAAVVNEEFVRDLAAIPERGLTPTFGTDGHPTGVDIQPPRDQAGYPRAVVGEVIIIHPNGDHEVLSGVEFDRKYTFRK